MRDHLEPARPLGTNWGQTAAVAAPRSGVFSRVARQHGICIFSFDGGSAAAAAASGGARPDAEARGLFDALDPLYASALKSIGTRLPELDALGLGRGLETKWAICGVRTPPSPPPLAGPRSSSSHHHHHNNNQLYFKLEYLKSILKQFCCRVRRLRRFQFKICSDCLLSSLMSIRLVVCQSQIILGCGKKGG